MHKNANAMESATGIIQPPWSSGVPYRYPSTITKPVEVKATASLEARRAVQANGNNDKESPASKKRNAVMGDIRPVGTLPNIAGLRKSSSSMRNSPGWL